MKNIKISEIKIHLKKLLTDASFILPEDIILSLRKAVEAENNATAKKILGMILENAAAASGDRLPLCQDCGNVYVNIEIGPGICLEEIHGTVPLQNAGLSGGGSAGITGAVNEAVMEIYRDCYLRKSIVSDPLYDRKNTENNLPPILHIHFSGKPGVNLEVNLKGGGSENCSWLFMLNPSSTAAEIIEKVVELVKQHGSKSCPPLIIGIGIGGSASKAPELALKAVFRNTALRNPDKRYAGLESKILDEVNRTGVGPAGLGGNTTALACNIEFAPCHMATLPFAVFFGCHSLRRASCRIKA